MTRFRNLVKDFFSISEKEANGFVGLTIFMIIVLAFPWTYKYYLENTLDPDPFVKTDHSFLVDFHSQDIPSNQYPKDSIHPFNPNKASLTEWKKMGLRNEIAERIEKYKAKGGRFKVKSDLLKIYGFSEDLYFKLNKFILLPDSLVSSPPSATEAKPKEKALKINLNKAKAEDLQSIKGIGSVLSARIIKFRDALGGFVKKEQLYEVYGLDSSVAQALIKQSEITKDFKPKTIQVNASYKTIASHPYIGWKSAKIIEDFNKNHGINSLDDLAKSKAFNKDELERISPYLYFDLNQKDTTINSGL